MKDFPLPLHREKGHLIVLDAEQLEWFRKYYPITENPRIAKAMGVSMETVRRLRTEYGISKSEAGLAAIRKRCARRAAKTNENNGCYDRKRGHAPSEATIEGQRKRWQEIREGKRMDPLATYKKRHPKKYKEMVERRNAKRKELYQKERLRVVYGLGRKTNLLFAMTPYTQSQTHRRTAALKRGYLLDVDCSEGTEGRYTIYYDDQTQRNAKFEENCKLDGFVFKRDEG